MKTKIVWAVILLVLFPKCAYSQLSFGQPEKINDEWRFILKDVDGAQSPNYNDTRWQNVDLPHDWSIKGSLSPTLASATGYLRGGIGWYRKTINIPKEKQGEKIYLYFEGVYNRSEVFINEQSLGKRPSGYASFAFDATPWIEYGKDNLIAVRVDHSKSADSRWYTGSGIYRNVWLVYAKPVHIAQWGVYAYPKTVTKKNAVISVDVEIENGSITGSSLTITNELLSQEGKVVAKETKKLSAPAGQNVQTNMELKVSNPQLWSIETPNLYQLKTTVLQGNKVIDETTTATGIRFYTFDPNTGFALNGQALKMKGVCLHHDAGVLGASVPKEVWKRRLLILKELGCNAIRCSHNPHSPELYELCDELGLLVIDEAFDEWEFPKRKWLEGWNRGTPGFEGIVDFFEAWGERDLADMVRRDRNHVSIFSWSIGNEIDYPNDPYSHPILNGTGKDGFTQPIFGGYQKNAPDAMRLGTIAKKLASVVRQYDKSRPVTAALAGVAMSNETEYPDALDLAGYNYTESFYLPDHKKYPNRVIYGSENGHSFDAWKAVTENPYIFGQFLWTGIDFLGEAGSWPSRGSSVGLLDL
ncbi:Beta-galactosidase BoGH2A, partial [termite gut metagenome]